MMVANSGILSTLTTTANTEITDKVDSPHSGLFKALHRMTEGNYTVKDAHSSLGLVHTFSFSGSNPQVAITAGKGLFNNKYITISALTTHTITGGKPSSGTFYHWARYNSSGTISIVTGTSDGVVPALGTGYAPISLIRVLSTDTAGGDIAFQLFTTSKTENSLSIGYEASNIYTEAMNITASSGDVTFKNTVSDKDIIFNVNDGGSDTEVMRIKGSNSSVGIGESSPVFASGGGLHIQNSTQAQVRLEDDSTEYFDVAMQAGNAYLINRVSDGTMQFWTNGSERMRILSGGNVGIGENAPDAPLHVTYTGTGDGLILESTETGTGQAPDLVLWRNSASPAVGDDVGTILFDGENDGGARITYAEIKAEIDQMAASSASGRLEFDVRSNNTMVSFIRLLGEDTGQPKVIVNQDGADVDFVVNGDSISDLLYINAGTDSIGIGTNDPSSPLHIKYTGAGEGLILESTEDGATNAPDLILWRHSPSPADDDELGVINFRGEDSGSAATDYAYISARTTDVSHSSEEGALKFGIFTNGVSTTMARLAKPNVDVFTDASAATVYAGWHTRPATVIIGAAKTYAPDVASSGTLIIFEHSGSNLTLPSVNDNVSVGVQFTVFNETGSAINGQIAVNDSATVNGGAISASDDIASYKAATFVCSGNNTWIRIG